MASSEQPSFSCPACNRRFVWKEELAGQRVTCPCGNRFAPQWPAQAESYEVAEDYDAAHPDPETRPAGGLPAGVPMFHRARPREEELPVEEASPVRHFWAPIGLMAIGGGLWAGQAVLWPWGGRGPAVCLGLALFMVVLNAGIMLAGVALAARILSVNFGAAGRAALKLLAAVLFAGAMGALVAHLDNYSLRGLSLGWLSMIVLDWVMFYIFFELDVQETLLSVAIVAMLQAMASCILWRT